MDGHSLAQHFLTEAYNNAWSNHRRLKACGQLTAPEFAAPRVSFLPSIRATLNHNLAVDWYYLEAPGRSLARPPPQLDEFYSTDEAGLRAADFAELGFDERAIWGARARPPA